MVGELDFFLFLLPSRFTEFGAGVENAVSNHIEMGHDISLHVKEVKDEDEEEALLHIQAHGQPCVQCLTPLGRAPVLKDSLCPQKLLPNPFPSHPLALALGSAVLHLFFRGFWSPIS